MTRDSDASATSAHDLPVTLLEQPDRPTLLVGEAPTHFDARPYRHEVATQWTPLAKRFAEVGVDVLNLGV